MKIEELLSQEKKRVLTAWFHRILETYPDETAHFLRREKDPFANPVGATIWESIAGLFEQLIRGIDSAQVSALLDRIIRVRAIQDFTPTQAIGFIFLLKYVIRQELGGEIRNYDTLAELVHFESKIDSLALIAFDLYVKCREQIYDFKTKEIKNRYFRLLQRANLLYEIPEGELDDKQGSIDNAI